MKLSHPTYLPLEPGQEGREQQRGAGLPGKPLAGQNRDYRR